MSDAFSTETYVAEPAAQAGRGDTSDAEDVTATVTSGAQPASDPPTVTDFMANVVAWPGSNEPGYINLHYSMPDLKKPGELLKGMGWPYRDVDELVKRAAWINTVPDKFKDVWFCTSTQSKSSTNKRGGPKAVRLASNATKVKSIWIDVDVGPPEPGKKPKYPDIKTALTEVLKFINIVKLPQPSAVVFSGGGIHFYWISDKALTPEEWTLYASGLKHLLLAKNILCDTGLTTDIARILRVPGTFNHKPEYGTPRPVTLAPQPLVMYDFSAKLSFLQQFAGPVITPHKATPDHPLFVDGVTAAAFGKPHPLFDHLKGEPDLNAGIDRFADVLLEPFPIFRNCGFLRDALRTGGKNYDQTLWMYSVLCTAFMEGGNEIAHKVSSGHPSYSKDETQALYERKLADRHDRGVGYLQCSTIQGAGCKSCATCPLLGKVKSPLNIRPAPVTATVTSPSSPSGSSDQTNWTRRSGISFANIPHRQWVYGFDIVRGELTVIGSPGGIGKSSLAIGTAICIATNRELLGEKIRGGGNLKALVINGEDSTDEIRRRVYAFCLAHGLTERDLIRLTVAGTDDKWVQKISFLKTNEKGMSTLNQDGLDALQLALDALRPDVIVLDPLVSFCAGGDMNSNAAMSSIMRKLKEIAARNECAMLIVHHTRKGGDAGNVEAISGAAAITNLARRAIMPVTPTVEEAMRLGVLPSERLQHFKLVDAKSNLAPRAADSPLYRLHSVELPNPEPPLYPHGDNVQAITRVTLPIQSSGSGNAGDMKIEAAILNLVDRGKEIDGQFYPYSASPAGANNLRALMPDAMTAVANATAPRQWPPGDLEVVINSAIKKMKTDGRIVEGKIKDIAPHAKQRFPKGQGLKAVSV